MTLILILIFFYQEVYHTDNDFIFSEFLDLIFFFFINISMNPMKI